MKRSKSSYRRAALKGWRTRRRNARLRSRGIEIEIGYSGRDNSYSLTVIINTHRPISQYSDSQVADLVEDLAQSGHFDYSPNNPVADLRWIGYNDFRIIRRNVRIKKGHARLMGFARTSPGTL